MIRDDIKELLNQFYFHMAAFHWKTQSDTIMAPYLPSDLPLWSLFCLYQPVQRELLQTSSEGHRSRSDNIYKVRAWC